MQHRKWSENLETVFRCVVLFYAVSMPFRVFFSINAVTEVRPASVLPPIFSMLWGFWGAFGAALGNLICDIQTGYSPEIIAIGFVLQFLYGYIPYLLWYYFPLKSEKKAVLPRMDSTAHILKYLGIDLINSLGMSFSLGVTMEIFHIGKLFSVDTMAIFMNNMVFTIILGIPILVIYSLRVDKRLSVNARVALFCVMQGVFAAVLVGISQYHNLLSAHLDPVLLWDKVSFYSFGAFIIFFGISIFFLRYMERQVTIPAEKLAEATKIYITQGGNEPDHDRFIENCQPFCGLNSEIGLLARASQTMVRELRTYMGDLKRITAERERLNTELNVAAQIQASMLPCIFPPFPLRPEFDIFATMDPAKEVGGDFYDFFLVDSDHIAMVIADVSGKGVPAALFMVIAKTLIKNSCQTGASPKQVLETVNNQLCENNEAEMFVTVWLGILEISTGQMTCANAGHEYPAIRRAGGQYQLFKDKHGFVLAGMENTKYREYEITLSPGDSFFVYTDGVAEATSAEKELYGTDRMLAALNQNPDAMPQNLLAIVKQDVDKFVDIAPQFDDITMLSFVYHGSGKEELTVPAVEEQIEPVTDFVNKVLGQMGCSPKAQTQIDIAVDEILCNISRYAYGPEGGCATVQIEPSEDKTCAVLTFIDHGRAYDPLKKPDPDVTLSSEDRPIGGLGIYLVKKTMDRMEYRYENGQNILTITKKII